jgi:cohesin loading factor subunit SCC2
MGEDAVRAAAQEHLQQQAARTLVPQVAIQQPQRPPAPVAPSPSIPMNNHAPPSSSQQSFMISVAQLTPEERAKFKEVSAPALDPSKKRKREMEEPEYQDQYARYSALVTTAEQIIDQTLQAWNNYRAESFDSEDMEYFHQSPLLNDSETLVLSQTALIRLDGSIRRTIKSGVFSQVAVAKVVRLQKLLEDSITCVTKFSFSIEGEASESEVEEWVQSLEIAATAVQSMKVLFDIMAAKREEKELYSEDLLGNAIGSLEHVIESTVIPVVEARTSASIFKLYSAKKRELSDLIKLCNRALTLLGKLVANVDVSESAVNKVEYLARRLIFIENAHSEKESVMGIQTFESMRRASMDTLASIFTRYPDMRTGIINDILLSLEKLPSTRQSARQFKLNDAKPIQLVSALLMRLVQTSALWTGLQAPKQRKKRASVDTDEENSDDDEKDRVQSNSRRVVQKPPIDMDDVEDYSFAQATNELRSVSKALFDNAEANAKHVINFLLTRALNTTKSGDQPYRALLDIFTEDFLNVIGIPEWPAAELLVYIMVRSLLTIMTDEKRPVPQKSLALDLLAIMGEQMSVLQARVKGVHRSLDAIQSSVAEALCHLVQNDEIANEELIKSDGAYRMVFQYLVNQAGDAQAKSAGALLLAQWSALCLDSAKSDEDSVTKDLLIQLRNTIPDHTWFQESYEDLKYVDATIAKHASTVIISASKFYKAQPTIIKALLHSINSPHVQIKSKGFKLLSQILQKDPSILERNNVVLTNILHGCGNSSSMVRQSALTLLEKCIELRPSLERKAYTMVIGLVQDENAQVRKRALKLLRDVFMRNDDQEMRAQVSVAVISRTEDHDDGVAELARQTFEELWVSPFYDSSTSTSTVQSKIEMQKQARLIVRSIDRGESIKRGAFLITIEKLFRLLLKKDSKNAKANFDICIKFVGVLFDEVIENHTNSDDLTQSSLGTALTMFAEVSPKLFNSRQLELLAPYIDNIQAGDALFMYHATCVIFRHVMPSLSAVEHDFLKKTQRALVKAVPKIPKQQIPDTAACLWSLWQTLMDPGPIKNLVLSLLKQLQPLMKADPEQLSDDTATRLRRYIDIVGPFGKECNFDTHVDDFKRSGFSWSNNSVASLIVDHLYPFTNNKYPLPVKGAALSSIGMICQAWPGQYRRNDVSMAFTQVFQNEEVILQKVILEGFIEFFQQEEKRSEAGAEIKVGEGAVHGQERLAKSFVASENDGAITTIAQTFLKHISRIALATTSDLAVSATKIIASINRQGMAHPKESGAALVALETSSNADIARMALEAHQAIHTKHESMFEKEYMRAVNQAFLYQRDVIKDPRGITLHPYTAKLRPLFEVLKTGSNQVRKRFLTNIVSRVNFELPKLDISGDLPNAVQFARFVTENLAFFDYARIDELLHLLKCLEDLVVSGVGASVAHTIEVEILKVKLPESNSQNTNGILPPPIDHMDLSYATAENPTPSFVDTIPITTSSVSPTRLRHLAVAAMILTMVWECRVHLRTMWGLQGKSKVKLTAKDFGKAPTRQPFVSAERFVEKVALAAQVLESPEAQMEMVKAFADLVAVDAELKLHIGDDEDGEDDLSALANKAGGYDTPSEVEGGEVDSAHGSAAKGRKRKIVVATANTPKRRKKSVTPKKGRPRKARAGSLSSMEDDDMDGGWD